MDDFYDRPARVLRRRLQAITVTAADIAAWRREQEERTRRLRPPANWAKWSHYPKAELWQCVALSFGVEPIDDMRRVQGGFVLNAEPWPRPWFANEEHADMRERLQVALANAGLDDRAAVRF